MHDATVGIELVGQRGAALGQTIAVGARALRIGRTTDNEVVLPDDGVSRHHAILEVRFGELWVRDLDSRNGTWVSGQRLVAPRALRPGDTLEVGTSAFSVRLQAFHSLLLEPDPSVPAAGEPALPSGAGIPLWWPLVGGAVGFLFLLWVLRACL